MVVRRDGPELVSPRLELSRLTAQVSHDLRVPLSAIIASLEILTDELGENPNPDVAALLERMANAADRMLRMLDHNLTLEPVAAGRPGVGIDLFEVANQLALDCARLLERAGATLEVAPLPVVCADPDDMYSVLQNLLINAVKFTPPGVRPIVSISARRVAHAWRVSVTDNGIGIPAERRAEVFTLFSRVDAAIEGHGIGLSTVARTVQALGGRVGVDDAPGGGAEVWFELPDVSVR